MNRKRFLIGLLCFSIGALFGSVWAWMSFKSTGLLPVGDIVYQVETTIQDGELPPEVREYCLARHYTLESLAGDKEAQQTCTLSYWSEGDRMDYHLGDRSVEMNLEEKQRWVLDDMQRVTDPTHSVRYD